MKSSILRLLTFAAAFAALAPAAHAADEPFVIADASSTQRFLPLAPVRAGAVPYRVDNGLSAVKPQLRSDRAAMANGFMRIDRTSLRPIQSFSGKAVASNPAPAVTVQRGGAATSDDQDITDLFAPGDSAPTASFHDALSGGPRFGGSIRHAWPLAASVNQKFTSGYGMRADPFTGRQAFHGGIDIAAAVGTPVLASAEGTVSKVASGKGLGNYVAVQHRDGSESYYGHLSGQNVRIGQHVMQGQKLGALGSTGRSTGPHLDYRIKKNGDTVNPLTVMRAPVSVDTRVASR